MIIDMKMLSKLLVVLITLMKARKGKNIQCFLPVPQRHTRYFNN